MADPRLDLDRTAGAEGRWQVAGGPHHMMRETGEGLLHHPSLGAQDFAGALRRERTIRCIGSRW